MIGMAFAPYMFVSMGAAQLIGVSHYKSGNNMHILSVSPYSRAVVLVGALALAGTAHANLVSNGSFETGDFSSWTVSPCGVGCHSIIYVNTDPANAQDGASAAGFAAINGSDSIAQDIATTAGAHYNVSFWLRNFGDPTNSFTFNWNGGADELSIVDALADAAFVQYTFSLTASAATTSLVFAGRQDPSGWLLDNVTVTAALAVPEPGSLALAGLALAGLGVARRRRAG